MNHATLLSTIVAVITSAIVTALITMRLIEERHTDEDIELDQRAKALDRREEKIELTERCLEKRLRQLRALVRDIEGRWQMHEEVVISGASLPYDKQQKARVRLALQLFRRLHTALHRIMPF